MSKARRGLLPVELFGFALCAALGSSAVGAATSVGEVTHLSGLLSVKRADGEVKVLSIKSEVREGDLLSTERETYARLKFQDGGELVLRPGTQVKVEAYSYSERKPESDNAVLNLLKGGFRAVTGLIGKRSRDRVSFRSPNATIGIRGTHFGMIFCNNDCTNVPTTSGQAPANGLYVDVAGGSIAVINQAGQAVLNPGQFGFVADARTPPLIVPAQQGIQVTMPQRISKNKGDGRSVGSGQQECTPAL